MATEHTNREMILQLSEKIDGVSSKMDRIQDALIGDKFSEGFIYETRRRMGTLEEKVVLVDKIESLETELHDTKNQLSSTKENFESFIQEHNRFQLKMVMKMLGAAGAGGGGVAAIAAALGG